MKITVSVQENFGKVEFYYYPAPKYWQLLRQGKTLQELEEQATKIANDTMLYELLDARTLMRGQNAIQKLLDCWIENEWIIVNDQN